MRVHGVHGKRRTCTAFRRVGRIGRIAEEMEVENLFVYGTLMYRSIWNRVVRGTYAGSQALLPGYERRRIQGVDYPALVRSSDTAALRGVLYRGLAEDDLERVDRFEDEGDAYSRIRVTVELDGGDLVDAWSYLFLRSELLCEEVWSPHEFERSGMRSFVRTYARDHVPEQ